MEGSAEGVDPNQKVRYPLFVGIVLEVALEEETTQNPDLEMKLTLLQKLLPLHLQMLMHWHLMVHNMGNTEEDHTEGRVAYQEGNLWTTTMDHTGI